LGDALDDAGAAFGGASLTFTIILVNAPFKNKAGWCGYCYFCEQK
jgi:hypothetical protein